MVSSPVARRRGSPLRPRPPFGVSESGAAEERGFRARWSHTDSDAAKAGGDLGASPREGEAWRRRGGAVLDFNTALSLGRAAAIRPGGCRTGVEDGNKTGGSRRGLGCSHRRRTWSPS